MMTQSTDIPLIDAGAFAADATGRAAALDTLRAAAHGLGAFYLVGHGIPEARFDEVLAVGRRLFALPPAELDAIAMIRSPHFRGYARVGHERTQGRPDRREQLDVALDRPARPSDPHGPAYAMLEGPNQWPEALPELRICITAWLEALEPVAAELLCALAESLGFERDRFASGFSPDPHVHLKIVHYPPSTQADDVQGVGSHKDYGFLTLLVQDEVGGLQLQSGDRFLDVAPRRGAFLVNLGEMLEVATGGYLTATVHRVLCPPAGVDRISVPYFYNPRLDYVVEPLTLPPEFAREARRSVDPTNPIFATYGLNALRGWVRSHPAVAREHHAEIVERLSAELNAGRPA